MSDASSALLAVHDVCMNFGSQSVLKNVNLSIRRSETVALIGESGCGKTVLLKLLIGLLHPSTGSIVFDGKDLASLSERELTSERLRYGFLFQGSALFDSLTVLDNVAFGLRALGRFPEPDIRERVRQRLHEVGLSPSVEAKKPAELSGGMKKRVGLARALALDPEVMLYDEPTTGLDPIMSDVINNLILQTRRQRPVTSVVVTHDMHTVYRVADRVVMLYPLSRLGSGEHQLLFDGTVAEMRTCPDERVRQFLEGEAGDRLRENGVPG